MTTRTVPTQFATIASADTASSNGDTIALVNGYSNETATLTHNLTVNGDATDTGIVLIMGTGVTSVTLTGTAPITVNDNAGNDSITGNAGNDIIKVTGGQDTVDGGTGNDRLIVNYSTDVNGVDMAIALATGTLDGYRGQYNDNAGNLVSFDNIENFNITTGSGGDSIATGSGNDVVSLGAGNDFIDSGTGVDQIDGGAGNDGWAADMSSATQGIAIDLTALTPSTFLGTGSVTGIEYLGGPSGVFKTGSGNDTIVTTAGNFTDNISTGAGDDTVTVAGGQDTVDGGTGNDRLIVNYSTDVNGVDMAIALATGHLDGYRGQYNDNAGNLVSFDNIENFNITTGSGGDSIATGSGNDVVSLGVGNDFIDSGGGAGNDGWAADMSFATQGIAIDLTALTPSTFLGTGSVTGIEYLGGPSGVFKTGSGNDTIVTTSGTFADNISTGAGDDTVTVAGGQDTVDGGTGNDRLIVNYSGDASGVDMGIALVTGTSDGYHGQYNDNTGNLVTFDNINNFTITTGGGADTIATGSGNDVVSLGAGNDFIDSGTGVDQIDGGAGNDGWAADMSSATQGIAIDLNAVSSTFLGTGSVTGIEYLGGPSGVFKTGSGNDTIVTTAGNFTDNISTGAGNDTITVAGGNDTVDGGTGNDRLIVNYSTDVNLVDMGIALATGTSDVLGITGGAPNDADATLTYQWQRDGSNITANGTGSTYTVAEADETHALQVVVTSHDTDASSTTTTSNATSAVTDNSSLAVSLDSVTANAGQTLNATAVRGAPSASAAGCAANDSRTPAGRLAEAPVHLRRSARESCLHLPRDSAKNKTGTHQVREPA
jgi:Ca2+-binding RTX toxin-like protein